MYELKAVRLLSGYCCCSLDSTTREIICSQLTTWMAFIVCLSKIKIKNLMWMTYKSPRNNSQIPQRINEERNLVNYKFFILFFYSTCFAKITMWRLNFGGFEVTLKRGKIKYREKYLLWDICAWHACLNCIIQHYYLRYIYLISAWHFNSINYIDVLAPPIFMRFYK